jgi:CBS domain-containing protein
MTQVSDVMTRGVRTLSPQDTMRLAAQAMDELDVGSIPVCDGKRLVGMVTDRDIIARGIARGLPPESTPLKDVMSAPVQWCFEDESVDEATELMRDHAIRRLPVVDHEKRLVGMLSLGDVAAKGGGDEAADALSDISEPARPDRSSTSAASGSAGGGETGGGSEGGRKASGKAGGKQRQ